MLLTDLPVHALVLVLVAGSSLPQSVPPRAPGDAKLSDTAAHVHIILPVQLAIAEGGDELTVRLSIDDGFHINANPASLDFLIPTTLNIASVTPISVSYPPPVRFLPKFAEGEWLDVYEGVITITALLPTGSLTTGRGDEERVSVTAQACTETICLPPADLPVMLSP